MKMGIAMILATIVLVARTGLAQDTSKKDDAEARKELASLQGSWQTVEREYLGKKATKEELEMLKGEMVIKDNTVTRWVVEPKERVLASEATIKIHPTAKPKALDLTFTKGPVKGTVLAIYELTGNSLRVCCSLEEDGKRPTEFAGKRDGKALLMVYKRVKP
jgi:uncharacterized protein (TIGR03067 family)